jgi:glycosyltransferase involved in cell wall biosynthesis
LPVAAPAALLEVAREGIAPLEPQAADPAGVLSVAVVVPSFRRGSGGHHTIADLVRGLEARGHRCSIWVDDIDHRHAREGAEEIAASFSAFFGTVAAPVRRAFAAWEGADVAVATGWQTVHRTLRLPNLSGRAYLVQDYEPDFYGASAERLWAEETYGLGLHCVAASPWLAALLRERHVATATHFDLGVDHAAYRPGSVTREEQFVAFYARAATPRRAVPLGLLALAELQRLRPEARIVLFGDNAPVEAPFPHEHLGVLNSHDLAALYARATVGVVLSLTNPSLVPTEMLACGLPCVDVASDSMVASFGDTGAIELAPLEPVGLAAAIARLLDDHELRRRRADAGLALVRDRTWSAAAAQVETGLRQALTRARGSR